MKIRTLFAALLVPIGLQAQFFYNASRDAKAQQAVTQAKDVTNGLIFDKMIENLDTLSKASGGRFFDDAERQMRANLSAFRTWGDLRTFTSALEQRLQTDLPGDANEAQIAAAVTQVESETNKAQTALKALKIAAETKFPAPAQVALIGTWFARLGELSDFIAFAKKFKEVRSAPAGFLDAASEAAALATSLGDMYKDFAVALAKTPDIVLLETQIQLLSVNEDHLKQLARILTQREMDLEDTRSILRRAKGELEFLGTSNMGDAADISQSIAARVASPPSTDRDKVLGAMALVMYDTAALAARGTTAQRLASLRLADEERRYSIRSSAVAAQSYETLVATGVDRLATYYKGGIKPEILAQIATALGTLGIIPSIAVK